MISIVIPAYNAAHTIESCLRALQQQTTAESTEIIVVDDASTDDTVAVATAVGARVISQGKLGKSGARNAGARAAKGEILLFTDADCEPLPDWVEQMLTPFRQDPEVVGAKGAYYSRQTELVARFTQVEVEERYDRMRKQPTTNFIDTYAAAYKRDIFLENGGFDTNLPELEDQDFSFRLAAKGYKMVFVPEARVYHRHTVSAVHYFRRKFAIGKWKAMLVHRHPERLVSDSRTPQLLKVQMGFVLLLPLVLIASLLWSPLGWVVLAVFVGFIISCLPFLIKTAQRDLPVITIALPMLFLRAASLAYGYVYGIYSLAAIAREQTPTLTGRQRLLKRTIDVAVSGLLSLLFLPPFAIIVGAVKLSSSGPIFSRQVRVGERGRPFTLYKFRSMQYQTGDKPQVTMIGRFLRRWRLDELPQLWNVLKGDMSLVGPRPEEADFLSHYSDQQRRRLAIKPGMTGPMQVNGRADLPTDERVQLELDYVDHYSLWRDALILAQTIPAVLKGTGVR
jgi:lipopolysaccharide/colanic/teichoic acid biosynthesis glycosyltransferase/glycosyltransferase involved in cell wall biosynthesis